MTDVRIRKIIVAAGFEAGSTWAHAINSINVAQGFSQLGHDVTLICLRPPGGELAESALVEQWGLTAPMGWVQLRSRFFGLDLKHWFGFAAMARSTIARLRPDLVYARDFDVPRTATRLGVRAVAETHAPVDSDSPGLQRLVRTSQNAKFSCLVTISQTLADYYVSLGVAAEKMLVWPCGVDLRKFSRPSLLPPSPFAGQGPHVVYSGHLYDYQGIPTVISAAKRLPHVRFHLIGGWPDDLARHRAAGSGLSNLVFHGPRPHAEVPAFLWHADLLLLPASSSGPSVRWMSPIKLGEYLASGTPTMVSDLPALRRWLTGEEVAFVGSDDPIALANGIQTILADATRAQDRGVAAAQKAKSWSIELRARAILDKSQLSN